MTVTPPSVGSYTGPVTQAVWAAFLISQINANGGNVPYTVNNINNIELWMTSEEPPNNWWHNWNPLNINAGGSGSDTFPNLTVAGESTGKLIAHSYPGILAALSQDSSLATFRGAVVASPWASGHYSGGSAFASTVPAQVSAGSGTTVLPVSSAAVGGVTPANPAPGPLGAIAGLATGGTSVPGSGGWTGELGTLLGDLTSSSWWKRVGLFSLGTVLVIGGIILFVSTTKTGQRVESDAAVAAVA